MISAMPNIVTGGNIHEAWSNAYSYLLGQGKEKYGLIVHIADARTSASPKELMIKHDPKGIKPEVDSIQDVANTIFPEHGPVWERSVENFCQYYKRAYDTLLRRGRRSWGCYFLRLIEFNDQHNQLSIIINKMNTWSGNFKAAFVIHFSAMSTDRPRKMGAPCLQYAQISVNEEGRVCMTAVYRAHDFFHKAYGNYIGLARLLEYIAFKTGKNVGWITCVSSYAFIDAHNNHANALFRGTV